MEMDILQATQVSTLVLDRGVPVIMEMNILQVQQVSTYVLEESVQVTMEVNNVTNIHQAPEASTPALVRYIPIMIAIPIALTVLVMGAIYLEDCPVQPYIPIYLLVSGVFTISLSLLSCLRENGEQNALSRIYTVLKSLLFLFLFCWFITGNVWVYSIYAPSYDPTDLTKYCNQTIYLFAFWIITLVYIVMGVLLVVGCCTLICMCLCCDDL